MDTQTLQISLSNAVVELLADNGVDLVSQLMAQGIDLKRGGSNDAIDVNVSSKRPMDYPLIILAIGASVPLICAGIAHVIRSLGKTPRVVVDHEYIPIRTPAGEIALDPSGKPIYEVRVVNRVINSHEVDSVKVSGLGISVDVSSNQKEGTQ